MNKERKSIELDGRIELLPNRKPDAIIPPEGDKATIQVWIEENMYLNVENDYLHINGFRVSAEYCFESAMEYLEWTSAQTDFPNRAETAAHILAERELLNDN